MSCPVARRELSIQILTEPNPHRCNPRETDSTWGPQTDTWSGSQARLPRRKASVWTLIKRQDLGTPCGVEDLTAVVCAGRWARRRGVKRRGDAKRRGLGRPRAGSRGGTAGLWNGGNARSASEAGPAATGGDSEDVRGIAALPSSELGVVSAAS